MVAPQTLDEGFWKTVRKGEPHGSAHCATEGGNVRPQHSPAFGYFLLPSLTPLRTLHKHKTVFLQGSRHAAAH